jgi:hypothetical protein
MGKVHRRVESLKKGTFPGGNVPIGSAVSVNWNYFFKGIALRGIIVSDKGNGADNEAGGTKRNPDPLADA